MTKRERVPQPFPHLQIKNIGGGTVGPVYLQRNATAHIEHAEAILYDAPFQRMIIDSPDILRIFGERGDRIDFSVLNHPVPLFRLEESEPGNFEVGVLKAVEYVRTNDRFGLLPRGRASSERISIIASAPTAQAPAARSRSQNERPTVQPIRSSGRHNGGPLVEVSAPNPTSSTPKARTPTLPPITPRERPQTEAGIPAITPDMEAIKDRILALLPEESRDNYRHYLGRGLQTMGKSGQKARDKMRVNIREVLGTCGDHFETAADLHNQYAELWQRIETRHAYHVPRLEAT
ncbi:hypothetical protein K458DRAFT_426768 [Lentithecium fluviatile CBS 122367]|uniref:Uncharacterized protein n=1 Tax=Lentithecium fluviatile CBS 122367 TaxID=1168545 RepID=A0A6G1JI95_9PLEO|nr:hypothetical protein K458DRAFT_426768 [Lentithecium fluviatile CBS 122367]